MYVTRVMVLKMALVGELYICTDQLEKVILIEFSMCLLERDSIY